MITLVNDQEFHNWLAHPSRSPKPLIMGVLNCTPNSFSDGGQYVDVEKARSRAICMIKEGADLIDVGGEASNPFTSSISLDEELARVIPVIKAIRDVSDVCISIDTCKALVMKEAVGAGASMINDIQALTGKESLNTAKLLDVPICLMHMKGTPQTMQVDPTYLGDVVDEINQFFHQRVEACKAVGILDEHIIIDPGIGFGKSTQHNLQILKRLSELGQHKLPLMLGVSRKNMIGELLKKAVSERMIGGIAIAVYAQMQGINILRTHDVDETNQALSILNALSI